MPCALFCQDAKISKAYSTEADVWKHAARNGLVVDVAPDPDEPTPKRILDNDYTIRPCEPDPKEKHDPGATNCLSVPDFVKAYRAPLSLQDVEHVVFTPALQAMQTAMHCSRFFGS